MNREELLNMISIDDIITLMKELGSEEPQVGKGNENELYFTTICHGGSSHKLCLYKNSKLFMCYTSCGSMSLYDLIMSVLNIDFKQAFKYLCKFKGIKNINHKGYGLQKQQQDNNDLQFLNLHLYESEKKVIQLPHYNKLILNAFDDYIPSTWIKEGIDINIAYYFQIKYYMNQNKAIIPHFDINNNLVGIRSRNFNKNEIEQGKKYMPITIQGLTYKYPMHYNLYGINFNKNNIIKYKKAIIFESEKSVLLYGTYYGQENNIALATSGMNCHTYQRDLLMSLHIQEVIIAYDKQYQVELLDDAKKYPEAHREYIKYIKKLIKICNLFINYCNISIITCWDNRLEYKDSPIDKNKKIFEELYMERYNITNIEELERMIE